MRKRTTSKTKFVAKLERANRKPKTPTQPASWPPTENQIAALKLAIRDNLSPQAVATIIAFLQPAAFYKPANEDALHALNEVEWFNEQLTEMLGVQAHNQLMEELGL